MQLMRTLIKTILKYTFICGLQFHIGNFAIADVAVITHLDASIGSIDKGTIKSIYLGKLKSWPDGSVLTVLDQKSGSPTRKFFIEKITGKKEIKFDAYWSKKVFSGKGIAPKNLGNDNDVKIKISKKNGSIGFIDTLSIDDSIKVLLIIK